MKRERNIMTLQRDGMKALLVLGLLLGLCSWAQAFDLEEIVEHMNTTAESIKDVEAAATLTKFDSIFEETQTSKRKLYFARPHLARVDTYEKRKGRDVLTRQIILGKDFVLNVWPETRHGELRRLSPDQIERMKNDRNDPISFFGKKLSEIRKDFHVEQINPPAETSGKCVVLVITPARDDVAFDYKKVEMVIDSKTWLPRSIKSFVGGDDDDWSLHEFTRIKLNKGLKAGTFRSNPVGIKVEVIEKKEEKQETK